MTKKPLTSDLGGYLREARIRAGLSQGEVARKLRMPQSQSISEWERNSAGSIPVKALRKLIEIYDLPAGDVYEVLLQFQMQRLEGKIERKYGVIRRRR